MPVPRTPFFEELAGEVHGLVCRRRYDGGVMGVSLAGVARPSDVEAEQSRVPFFQKRRCSPRVSSMRSGSFSRNIECRDAGRLPPTRDADVENKNGLAR